MIKKRSLGLLMSQSCLNMRSGILWLKRNFLSTGTDSRIGFGYRLGEHADIQVQFEIGPQKETKTIGTASNKRSVKPADEFEIEKEDKKVKFYWRLEMVQWFIFISFSKIKHLGWKIGSSRHKIPNQKSSQTHQWSKLRWFQKKL